MARGSLLTVESESYLPRRVYRFRYADRTRDGDGRFSFSFCSRLDFVFGRVVTVFPWGRCGARTPAASSRFPDHSSRSVADRCGTDLAIDAGETDARAQLPSSDFRIVSVSALLLG